MHTSLEPLSSFHFKQNEILSLLIDQFSPRTQLQYILTAYQGLGLQYFSKLHRFAALEWEHYAEVRCNKWIINSWWLLFIWYVLIRAYVIWSSVSCRMRIKKKIGGNAISYLQKLSWGIFCVFCAQFFKGLCCPLFSASFFLFSSSFHDKWCWNS